MIDFTLTILVFVVGTLVPAYVALYLIDNLKMIPIKYIAAVGVGLAFWYFFDTMGDAVSLMVNSSIYPLENFGGLPHIGVILAFLIGIATLAIFDHTAIPKQEGILTTNRRISMSLFLIPAGVAFVMGIHGLGEGWEFGSAASSTPVIDLLSAFGGSGPGSFNPIASYPLHKLFEAAIIASLFTVYVGRNGAVSKTSWQIPVLGLLFGLPSIIGTAVGYFVVFDSTFYFFAFGVTSAIYAITRLVEPMFPRFMSGTNSPVRLDSGVFAAIALGFFLLYFSALLH